MMPEFLVHYSIQHPAPRAEGGSHTSDHALLVEAETRRDAYLVAFDFLTREGYRVSTMLTNRWKGQIAGVDPSRDTHELDFTDEDLEAIRDAGVPVDAYHGSDVRIERIDPYCVRTAGRVISRRGSPPSDPAA